MTSITFSSSAFSRLTMLVFLVKSDLYRYDGELSLRAFLRNYIHEPGFNFLVWFRVCSVFHSKFIGWLLHRKKIRFGIDIPAKTAVGEGLYIGHYGGIVINGRSVIGKNCNISQGVTLGIVNRGEKLGVPVIGDFVYIGPGAKIIGKIKIGNNVAIGANAVVTRDVPDNAVVVGVPARCISFNGSAGYINNVLNGECL